MSNELMVTSESINKETPPTSNLPINISSKLAAIHLDVKFTGTNYSMWSHLVEMFNCCWSRQIWLLQGTYLWRCQS